MEFHQLHYFKTIAETENVSTASRKLHVSQPFLSRIIKSLEEELNVQLFDRNGKKIIINENGKILYTYATQILELHDEAIKKLTNKTVSFSQSLHISMLNSTKLFPELIRRFCEANPNINISVLRFTSIQEIPENCDIIIHASESLAEITNSTVLLQEECLLGMSVNHPLAIEPIITARMLEKQPFLLLTQENTLGDLTRRYFKPIGINPNVPIQCDNQQTLTAFVEEEMGLAFFPSKTWKIESDKIILRTIKNHKLYRNIYISVISEQPTIAAINFRNFLSSQLD